MTDEQFTRLLLTIDRNTEAQIETGKQIARLADETVTLATMLAQPEEEDAHGESEWARNTDLAGRPIG